MCEWLAVAQGATNCADCNAENPNYFNPNYEIFVCRECAQIHESIICKKGHLKSVRVDTMSTDKQQQAVSAEGNVKVNGKLERFLPVYYPKQGESTPPDLRKEFITHKYLRETFSTHASFLKYPPASGRMEGPLEKKAKDKSTWKPRHFVLSSLSIEYYLELGHWEPKSRVPLSQLELHLEEWEKGRSCLVLTQLSDTGASGRKYYVRSVSEGRDPDQLFDWYFALLTAVSLTNSTYKGTLSRAVVGLISESKHVTKSGVLYKVGTHALDIWRKRWFSINGTHVTYSASKLCAMPQGDFTLGAVHSGYRVEVGVSHRVRAPSLFTFQIVTPGRTYKLCAESEEDRDSWMLAFSGGIDNGDDFKYSNSI